MVPLPQGVQSALEQWTRALEARHLQDLTFQEVARALRSLSSCYVERRGRLAAGDALDGRGKRAAFALFYAPLHLVTTAHIVRSLGLQVQPVPGDRARALGLPGGTGLMVAGVRPGSVAADAGFRSGDVIEEVNRRPVGSAAALRDAVSGAGARPVLVLVRRGYQQLYHTHTPPRS